MFRLKKLYKHPLFWGGALMLVGTNLANFFAYLYHLIFGRLLGPSGYGEFAAVVAIIGVIASTFTFFSTAIVKFASSKKKIRDPQIDNLIVFANKTVFVLLLVFTAFSVYLAKFLGISVKIAFLVGPNVYLLYLLTVYSAILQSDLKFGKIVLANNSGWLVRLLLGVLAINLGFGIFGIFVGYFIASIVSVVMLINFVKLKATGSPSKKFLKKFFAYSLPVIVVFISTTSFMTIDVVLVKRFFSSYETGLYASLSALGKIVFFGTYPITAVIFPLVAKKSFENKSTKMIFFAGFGGVLTISFLVLVLYFLAPGLVINLMFGSGYLAVEQILGIFGISSLIFSSNYIFVNYYLSKDVKLPSLFVFLGAALQAVGIILFHSSLKQVILISIFASSVELIFMVLYSLRRLYLIRRQSVSSI